ncbi:MAG TPA: sortase [Candidatus Saccharimonadales bacterium]|nr:sortase [Candidatus Saccharimonadales bacterium]
MATNPAPQSNDNSNRPAPGSAPDAKTAADIIREKVARAYSEEPDASKEAAEAAGITRRSKHQRFMHDLSNSGKDLAAIQNEWHDYYQALPDHEKHQVWQEFYESMPALYGPEKVAEKSSPQAVSEHKKQAAKPPRNRATAAPNAKKKLRDARSKEEVQTAIRNKVSAGGKLQAKHHFQSLLFGLGIGVIVIIIFLFGFFNEVFITPFIQPGRTSADAPLIVNTTVAPSATPEVIIPKINVEIPVDYTQTSTNEADIENALEDGVVHYPTTVLPGQNGNAAFFGHSSNNIFNKGKYKFAFVLLHTLQPGDTFYLTYSSKVYAYKVISKNIVPPNDVSVLGPVAGQTATATLITCDPPGTSINRLVVVGQQISPDPSSNTQATTTSASGTSATTLPGNGPTLLTRVVRSWPGKIVLTAALLGILFVTLRWINQPKRALQAR